jgi:tRNA(Ile2) C34 agmatinyltransferase TiaS
MSEHDQWCTCPNCKESTAMNGKNGKLRCIHCGYGLAGREQWATPEKSRTNAKFMRGER